jgi:hypothetical protein
MLPVRSGFIFFSQQNAVMAPSRRERGVHVRTAIESFVHFSGEHCGGIGLLQEAEDSARWEAA